MYYTSLIILSKSQPNWSSSSRENAEKQVFLRAKPRAKNNLAHWVHSAQILTKYYERSNTTNKVSILRPNGWFLPRCSGGGATLRHSRYQIPTPYLFMAPVNLDSDRRRLGTNCTHTRMNNASSSRLYFIR